MKTQNITKIIGKNIRNQFFKGVTTCKINASIRYVEIAQLKVTNPENYKEYVEKYIKKETGYN